ncbi:MAG: pitrilysin family protein [Cyanobacteria bacterium P01_A01_bin.45]
MTSTLLNFHRLNAPKLCKMSNGLTIIVEQIPVEAVNLSLWTNIGSALESDAINGMAHFLEHMIFKGTEKLMSGEFERLIEERGAITNAATSQDYTHYYITTAPKDFASLAPLQIDVVLNPSIPDDDFERERSVVLEEIRRAEDNPKRRIFRRSMEMAFNNLPYRRPILGPESVISGLQPQQMRDFHEIWYHPPSITAVAVGNLPVEELLETVEEGFITAGIRTDEGVFDRTVDRTFDKWSQIKPEEKFTEIVREEYVDESLQQARLIMVWKVPGINQLPDTYALDMLAGVLGHGKTSRLFRDLREERGLVSYIGVSNMTNRLQGTFYISAYCNADDINAVETAIVEHIQNIQSSPVTELEINKVRKRVANRFIFANEKPSDRAGLYGYYQTLVGDLQPAFDYPSLIQQQDAEDLQLAARRYLSPDAYGVLAVKPAH